MSLMDEVLHPTIIMACDYAGFKKNQTLAVINTCNDGYAVMRGGKRFWIPKNFTGHSKTPPLEMEFPIHDEDFEPEPRQRRKMSKRQNRRSYKDEEGDG